MFQEVRSKMIVALEVGMKGQVIKNTAAILFLRKYLFTNCLTLMPKWKISVIFLLVLLLGPQQWPDGGGCL